MKVRIVFLFMCFACIVLNSCKKDVVSISSQKRANSVENLLETENLSTLSKDNLEEFYIPTSEEDFLEHWEMFDPISLETSRPKIIIRANFRPCRHSTCCCAGAGGICLCMTIERSDKLVLDNQLIESPYYPLTEEEYQYGNGTFTIDLVDANTIKVIYLDRLNYDHNLETIIEEDIYLGSEITAKLGLNLKYLIIPKGKYIVNPSTASKYGEFYVSI